MNLTQEERVSKLHQQIYLARIKLRPFQAPAIDALENAGFKRLYLLWHRRAGKDYVAFLILIRQALLQRGNFIYCLPTYRLARRIVMDSLLSDGTRFLSMIPEQLVAKINSVEMNITLINGSVISIVGSNTIEKNLVGINPRGIIYSEWSRSLHSSWAYLSPAIVANAGFAVFITTPKGKNFAFEMWDRATRDKAWFCSKKTVEDTGLVDLATIQKEREEFGNDFINQEYYCSFVSGEGCIYGNLIDKLYLNDHVTDVPEDKSLLVHTFWDFGYNDPSCIIWAQISPGGVIRVIDCMYDNKKSLVDWCKIVLAKPYNYGTHWAPHDAGHHDFGSGLTRFEQAEDVGLKFETIAKDNKIITAIPSVSLISGIERTKSVLPNCYFDEIRCEGLLKGLDNYRYEWDEKRSVFKDTPVHNKDSHYADAFRYLALSIHLTRKTITADQLRENYFKSRAERGNFLPRGPWSRQ